MAKNLPTLYTQQPIVPVNRTYPNTVAERKGAILGRAQVEAMRREQIKNHFAGQILEEISTSRLAHFDSGTEDIWAIKTRAGRPADLQDIIDQAAVNITLRFDSYLQKSADIAAAQVIGIQGASSYIEPAPEEKGFFRKRLKG